MSVLTPVRRRGAQTSELRRRARAPRPAPDLGPSYQVVSTALTMLALLALWLLLQVVFLSGVSQAREQHLLYQELRTQMASAVAPVGPVITPGAPVSTLIIPTLGLQQVVVEGTSSSDLRSGPGHRRDTVLPGQEGVSAIYGRASTYGRPFARIAELSPGDRVVTQTAQGRTEFQVLGVRRAGDPLPASAPDGASRLVLVSAEGSGRLAGLRPSDAIYVDAQSTTSVPFPPGRPGSVPDSEMAMATDRSALPALAVPLAGLVALSLAVAAGRQRWSTAMVWTLATPVALALAWLTTDTAVRLLPNLL